MIPLQSIQCFVFDLDGTIYLGGRVIPGARELLALLDERRIPYCFFTNNSSKSPGDYVEKLARLGLGDFSADRIITSGNVTARYVLETYGPRANAYIVGTEALKEQLALAGVCCLAAQDPDCVIVGFDTTFCYAKAEQAAALLQKGVPFLATNIDAVCPLEDGKMLPDCASICAMLTHATGKHPKYLGKPFAETALYLQRVTKIPAANTAVVGDRAYTDMRLALDNGMCAIGVLSGEMTQTDLDENGLCPDYLLGSVADLYGRLKDI